MRRFWLIYGEDIKTTLRDLSPFVAILAMFTIGWFSHAFDVGEQHPDLECFMKWCMVPPGPISPLELGEWTPHRVEATYDSGLTVVSSLGPHGNYQYVVANLHLPVGTTFRNWNNTIVEVM